MVCLLQRCLVRNPRERISIAELLEHPYLQLKPQASPEPGIFMQTHTHLSKIVDPLLLLIMWHWPDHNTPVSEHPCNSDLKKILTDLAALQSPNSIIRAANVRFTLKKLFLQQESFFRININSAFCFSQNLAKMCSSGRKLDVAECAKSSS